jgi:pyruvate kinase
MPVFRHRQTKIVATVGPATSTPQALRAVFEAGVDIFRLNFSHGEHKDHGERVAMLRQLEKETGKPIAILADLQGPKLRLGKFENGKINISAGDNLRIDLDVATLGNNTRVGMPHPEIIEALVEGSNLLLDDGKVRLLVTKKGKDFVETRVIAGTMLSDRKGVNVPDVMLNLSALTDKDRKDLTFALDQGVDWVALSFVQRAEDVTEARRLIGGRASIIAKIEKPQAIDNIDDIINLSDGIMVARGDLGVEMPPEEVPILQKTVVQKTRAAGKPVIVATQMLESMIGAPSPTRAEASDVATAVYDGADAIMLSAETASGQYPVEAVTFMDRITRRIEQDERYRALIDAAHPDLQQTAADAITAAAHQVADTIQAAAIVTYTTSGSTTLRAARERPSQPILCLTAEEKIARRLVLSYGVHTVLTDDVDNFTDMVNKAVSVALEEKIARDGERLVITAGVPFGTPGSTNVLRIAWINNDVNKAA